MFDNSSKGVIWPKHKMKRVSGSFDPIMVENQGTVLRISDDK